MVYINTESGVINRGVLKFSESRCLAIVMDLKENVVVDNWTLIVFLCY